MKATISFFQEKSSGDYHHGIDPFDCSTWNNYLIKTDKPKKQCLVHCSTWNNGKLVKIIPHSVVNKTIRISHGTKRDENVPEFTYDQLDAKK